MISVPETANATANTTTNSTTTNTTTTPAAPMLALVLYCDQNTHLTATVITFTGTGLAYGTSAAVLSLGTDVPIVMGPTSNTPAVMMFMLGESTARRSPRRACLLATLLAGSLRRVESRCANPPPIHCCPPAAHPAEQVQRPGLTILPHPCPAAPQPIPTNVPLSFMSPIAGYMRIDNTSSFAYTFSNSTGKMVPEQFMVYNTTDAEATTPIPPGSQMFIQVRARRALVTA